MKNTIISIIALFCLSVVAHAQVSASSPKGSEFGTSIHGLGFSGGPASGVGISYRFHTEGKSSLQGVLGIFKPKTTDTFYSFGFEFQQDLTRSDAARFFICAASSYEYYGSGSNKYKAPYRGGVGLGGEFLVQDALHFTLEGLFTYFSDGTILPLPQMAFHYYFF